MSPSLDHACALWVLGEHTPLALLSPLRVWVRSRAPTWWLLPERHPRRAPAGSQAQRLRDRHPPLTPKLGPLPGPLGGAEGGEQRRPARVPGVHTPRAMGASAAAGGQPGSRRPGAATATVTQWRVPSGSSFQRSKELKCQNVTQVLTEAGGFLKGQLMGLEKGVGMAGSLLLFLEALLLDGYAFRLKR